MFIEHALYSSCLISANVSDAITYMIRVSTKCGDFISSVTIVSLIEVAICYYGAAITQYVEQGLFEFTLGSRAYTPVIDTLLTRGRCFGARPLRHCFV